MTTTLKWDNAMRTLSARGVRTDALENLSVGIDEHLQAIIEGLGSIAICGNDEVGEILTELAMAIRCNSLLRDSILEVLDLEPEDDIDGTDNGRAEGAQVA